MKMTKLIPVLMAAGWLAGTPLQAADPVVSNVRASQRAGDKLVDIQCDVANAATNWLTVTVAVSTNGGATTDVPATHFSGDGIGFRVSPGTNKLIVWNARADWDGRYSTNVRFQVTATETFHGMFLIPAGPFTMGDTFPNDAGTSSDALPLHTNQISAFYMDQYEVTKALWDEVRAWANSNGYDLGTTGLGKAANHPVHTVSWYDVVKWCNARSEREGRVPAYYTSATLTTVYRTGSVDVQNGWVNWTSGYRVPTEAEWEKAARGGASGQRFPWSSTNNITHSLANYRSFTDSTYDTSPTWGYHPSFQADGTPYTSPVGYFAPNDYALYDMAGNVWEWTWDWYGSYSSNAQTDPRGPTSPVFSLRLLRGGGWSANASGCRAACRGTHASTYRSYDLGFRSVLPPGQP